MTAVKPIRTGACLALTPAARATPHEADIRSHVLRFMVASKLSGKSNKHENQSLQKTNYRDSSLINVIDFIGIYPWHAPCKATDPSSFSGDNMEDMKALKLNRRFFLKSGGTAAAVAGSVVIPIASAQAATPGATGSTALNYPSKAVAKAKGMPVNDAVAFTYPDENSPCVVLRMGHPVPGGVGPNQDIVAYSALCTHMGCPVAYDGGTRTFKCGCHFSVFDPEMGGQMVCGQATEDLPRVKLHYDAKTDTVTATGIDGLIYGRQANVL
jgi:arsenite oxidase small subunit